MEDYVDLLGRTLDENPRKALLLRMMDAYDPDKKRLINRFLREDTFSMARAATIPKISLDLLLKLYLLARSTSEAEDLELIQKIKEEKDGELIDGINARLFADKLKLSVEMESRMRNPIQEYIDRFNSVVRSTEPIDPSSLKTTITEESYSIHLEVPIYDIFNSIRCNQSLPLVSIRWPEGEDVTSRDASYNYKIFSGFRDNRLNQWTRGELERNQLSLYLLAGEYIQIIIDQHISNVSSTMTLKSTFPVENVIELLSTHIVDDRIRAVLRDGTVIGKRSTVSVAYGGVSIPRALISYGIRNIDLVQNFLYIDEHEKTFITASKPRFKVKGYKGYLFDCMLTSDISKGTGKNKTYLTVTFFDQIGKNQLQNVHFLGRLFELIQTHSQAPSLIFSALNPSWKRGTAVSSIVAEGLEDLRGLRRKLPDMVGYSTYPNDCERKQRPKLIEEKEYKELKKARSSRNKVMQIKDDVYISCAHNTQHKFPGLKIGAGNRVVPCCFKTHKRAGEVSGAKKILPTDLKIVGGGRTIKVANKVPIGPGFYGYLPPALETVMRIKVSKKQFLRYEPMTIGQIDGLTPTNESFLACVLVAIDPNYIGLPGRKMKEKLLSVREKLAREGGPLSYDYEELLNATDSIQEIIEQGNSRYLLSLFETFFSMRIYIYEVSNSGKMIVPEEPVCYGNFVRSYTAKRSCIILKYRADHHPQLQKDLYNIVVKMPRKSGYNAIPITDITCMLSDVLLKEIWDFCYVPSVLMYGRKQLIENASELVDEKEDKQLLDPIRKRAGEVVDGNFYWTARSTPLIGVRSIHLSSIKETELDSILTSKMPTEALIPVDKNGYLMLRNNSYTLTNNPQLSQTNKLINATEKMASTLIALSSSISKKKLMGMVDGARYLSFGKFHEIYFDAILIRTAAHMLGLSQNLQETIKVSPAMYEKMPNISYVIRSNTQFLRESGGVLYMYVLNQETKKRIIRLVKTYEIYDPEYIMRYGESQLYFDWKIPTQLMKQFSGNVILTSKRDARDYTSRAQENRVYDNIDDGHVFESKYSFLYRGSLTDNYLSLIKKADNIEDASQIQIDWSTFRKRRACVKRTPHLKRNNILSSNRYIRKADTLNYIKLRKNVLIFLMIE